MNFLLIPGAGGESWIWHRVESELKSVGHHAVSVDLPADDETAGIEEYADIAQSAIRWDRSNCRQVVSRLVHGRTRVPEGRHQILGLRQRNAPTARGNSRRVVGSDWTGRCKGGQ